MQSDNVRALKAKIIGFQVSSLRLSRFLRKAKGEKRARLRMQKRALGDRARLHLIAYGLIRGVPYQNIERPGRFNVPEAQRILDIIKEHDPWNATWRTHNANTLRRYLSGETTLEGSVLQPLRPLQQPPQAVGS